MADNTILNVGVGGDTIATDDIAGVKYERVKVNFGADGAATDASSANPLPVDTELTVADLDTGAGTDTRAVVGLARAESGGATLVGSANPLPVNQTAALPAGNNNIGDVDIVTVPAPLSTTGGGTEATALRVTVANNSTGVLPVTDNGSSLTVDAPVGTPAFVRLSDGAAAITALPVTDNAGSITVDTTAANFPINNSQVSGTAISVNTGTRDAGTQRVILASDQTVVPISDNSGSITVDGSISIIPTTTGGLTTFHLSSAATTNATNIKSAAGQLFGYYVYNSNASPRKVAFHNTAGTPTAGAAIFFSIVLPAQSAANVEFSNGITFATGIAITTVTGLTDADASAVAAQDLDINIFYK